MKIAIVGNYGNNNNGDEAILLGIITQLTENFDVSRSDIMVFSNNPFQTRDRYGVESYPLYYKTGSLVKTFIQTAQKARELLKGVDLVIVGGGGILMDLYKREAPLYGTYGIIGKSRGAHVVVYGCGAGPIHTGIGKFFLKRLAKAADSVSVRDPKSKKLLESIGIQKPIEVIGDPAFTLTTEHKHQRSEKIQKVGVTAVPYYNKEYWPESDEKKYNDYVQGMAQNLDRVIKEKQVEVTFFSTKYPQDVQVTKDIYEAMTEKQNAVVNESHLSPVDLMKVCGEQDLVVGTRLHSIILSIDAETPVLGVAYHHKVQHFMEMVELNDNSFSMEALNQSDSLFLDAVARMNESWESTQDKTVEISKMLKEKAAKGLQQFSMLPKKGSNHD